MKPAYCVRCPNGHVHPLPLVRPRCDLCGESLIPPSGAVPRAPRRLQP